MQPVMGSVALGKVGVLVCGGMQGWETLRVERRGVGRGGEFASSAERRFSKPALELQSHTLRLA